MKSRYEKRREIQTELDKLVKNYKEAKKAQEKVLRDCFAIRQKVLNSGTYMLIKNEMYLDDEDLKEYRKGKQQIIAVGDWYKIICPKIDYMMEKEESNRYLKDVHIERKKWGYNLDTAWNIITDIKTKPVLKAAENALLDYQYTVQTFLDVMQDEEGLKTVASMHKHWKFRDDCIKFMCGLDLLHQETRV